VRGDGQLPPVLVTLSTSSRFYGAYVYRANAKNPLGIRLSTSSPHPELTLAHEIGHLLDHWGFSPQNFASTQDQRLDALRQALAGSQAVQTLEQMLRSGTGEISDNAGNILTVKIDRPHLRYLLKPEELWARAYSQYIATRSGDTLLLEQAGRIAGRADSPYRHRQWTEADFAPIAQTMDELMEVLGWRQK